MQKARYIYLGRSLAQMHPRVILTHALASNLRVVVREKNKFIINAVWN